VALDPHSGLVRAWIGGRDFNESQFNRVDQGLRQIGSTVKPFLYLSALDGSLNSYKVASPISVLEDKPMAITARNRAAWVPENFDRDFRGDVSLRYALENSLNMPAIYVAQRIGVPTLKRTLEAFQVAAQIPAVPALALGALDTNLLQLTSAYGALATLGVHATPRLYVSALDGAGTRLSGTTLAERRVADEAAVFVLTDILQGVLARGTGKAARTAGFGRPAAGKSGTSDKTRDAWFVGYTPSLVVGVWVGFDDNTPTGLSGGGAAAPIWGDFMHCSEPFIPDLQFLRPAGVQVVAIDSRTGEVATPDCPAEDRIEEVFVSGTEPTSSCHEHGDSTTPAPTDERRYPSGEAPEPSWWDRILG
jgi:membrane carboxypeptidase/penicillin-binding protein